MTQVTFPSKKLPPGTSLAEKAPEIANQWHPSRNHPVTAGELHAGSPNKAWWLCLEGHVWCASVRDRVRKKSGCPFCSRKRASEEYCLASEYPGAAVLWHPTRNFPDTPWTVMPGSNRKVW